MARRLDRTGEGGFTMVEVIVSLGLITVLMASLTAYFVNTQRVSAYQAQIQAATRVAQTGMEAARGYGGPTLLVGRAACGTCLNVNGYDRGYLTGSVRYDAAVSGVTPTVAIPPTSGISADVTTVGGIEYSRYYFVARCWQAAAGGLCTTTTTLPVAMVRLVVGVVWQSSNCPSTICVRAASSLFSADPSDPVFTQ
jgi:type II secretory pathway pseudopilin PulG